VDAASQVAKLAQPAVELLACPGQHGSGALRIVFEASLEQRQLERGGHQALLGAVVKVALDATPCLVRGCHEPRARRRQLVPRLRVLDRVRHELRERRDPVLGARRHQHARRPHRRDGAPDAAADDDRPAGAGADPELPHQFGDDAADLVEVLDPDGPLRLQHLPEHPAAVERAAMADRDRRRGAVGPAGHDFGPLRAHDAQKRRPLRPEQHADLLGDGGEDLLARGLARDERGDAPQRRVLPDEFLEGSAGHRRVHEPTLTPLARSVAVIRGVAARVAAAVRAHRPSRGRRAGVRRDPCSDSCAGCRSSGCSRSLRPRCSRGATSSGWSRPTGAA
jgi:hypothetical protein